jgi:hypothetical protein
MYLTGLIHRDDLFQTTLRWLADRPEPGDGRRVSEIFCYEPLIAGPVARRFFFELHSKVRPGPLNLRRLHLKDQLRDAIVEGCGDPSPRAQAVFEQYRDHPEEFFPGTPSDLLLATDEAGCLLGMIRVKRIRRIAEKASRRIADKLAGRIRDAARQLAEQRAWEAGLPLDQLRSSSATMSREFAAAERIVSRSFRDRTLQLTREEMRIDDVIGCKLIGTPDELESIERAIEQHPRAHLAEREEHSGEYNATNLLVDLELPPPEMLLARAEGIDWSFAAARGLEPNRLQQGFEGYLLSGARTLRAEVILTTFDELVESEFGRSMHEERILEQRRSATYTGRIAQNASFLVQYLLTLAISPTLEADPLPVKMWGRYLPDTFSAAHWRLYGFEQEIPLAEIFGGVALETLR